jgi:hypothetical protein
VSKKQADAAKAEARTFSPTAEMDDTPAVSAVDYSGASAVADVIEDLNTWVSYASDATAGVFSPDTLVTSPRRRNWLQTTMIGAAAPGETIASFWLRTNGRISKIEEAWECQGVGPAGEDAMLFYRNNTESIAIEIVQPFSTIPAQRDGFVETVYAISQTGGVVMRESGHNTLIYTAGAQAVA